MAEHNPQGPAGRHKRRHIAWAAIAVFVVLTGIAIYAAVHQGVKSIDLSHGTIAFNEQSGSSIRQGQPALHAKLSSAQSDAQNQAQGQAAPSGSAAFRGRWLSSYGLTYVIAIYGSQAVVQEQSPFGITAVGEGPVTADRATFSFAAIDGSQGEAEFDLVSNQTIHATFDNSTSGRTTSAVLTRSG